MRALRLVAMATVVVAVGWMTLAQAGAASSLKSRMLALSELPTGWTVTHGGAGGVASNSCLSAFHKASRHGKRATVSYANGTTTFLEEGLATGPGELGRLHVLNRALKRCHGVTLAGHGKKLHLSISRMSFPKVSRTSVAVSMRTKVTKVTIGFDIVTFRADKYEGFLGYGGLGNPDVTTVVTFVKEAVAKAKGKTTTSPPATKTPGVTQSVTSQTGVAYSVQLVQVTDPASPATPTVTTPGAGDRFVAAEFTIADTGSKPLSDDANSDVTVVGSNNQTYRAGFATISGCTNFNSGSFALQPGESVTGCVVFTVPNGVSVAKVEWSPSGGFTSHFVEWSVP